ncbi:MAG: DUF2993 domain-containing protein [Spirulina sp. DLM2.Bin59]|nr:MAG: DUF2993 domain-containing protein [Spirulina sp. DLM2.Bin59]
MEFFTILLSGLLGGISPTGLILDQVMESQLHNRLPGSESITVRIDNRPNHQVLQGKVDRIRLASRGLQLTSYLRLHTLELDTDPVSLDLAALRRGGNPRASLRAPLNAATRLVVHEDDLNAALAAPEFQERLQGVVTRLGANLSPGERYQLQDIAVNFTEAGRVEITAAVKSSQDTIVVALAGALTVQAGHQIMLVEPVLTLNGNRLPPFVEAIALENLQRPFDLTNLERQGLFVRILQLKVESEQLAIAGFVRLTP